MSRVGTAYDAVHLDMFVIIVVIWDAMLDVFLTPDYAVFTASFMVMIGVGVIEALGLGLGHWGFDTDFEHALDADGVAPGVLDWLGLKKGMPALIWLTAFLACFTFVGMVVQQIATVSLGAPLYWGLAAPIAFGVGLFVNSFFSAGLARILPEFETSVIDAGDLVMRRGVVLEGAARRGHPARARVVDQHGQAHYVMIEPHVDGEVISQGETALLVRRDGPLFFAQPESSSALRPI